MLTLLGLSSNAKLELATVADDDRGPGSVFLVRRNIDDFGDDIFISADHPAEHHVFV